MTKIASKVPEAQARPVYVDSTTYEIWYSKPTSLGKIHNRNGYWYTEDNHRFASSRDAMRYLVYILELTGTQPATVLGRVAADRAERMESRRIGRAIGESHGIRKIEEQEIPTSKPGVTATYTTTVRGKHVGPAREKAQRAGATNSNTDATDTEINQNHPMFQQFLDFLDYQARRKIPRVDSPSK